MIEWAPGVKYGEIFKQPEREHSTYSFDLSNTEMLLLNLMHLKRSNEFN